MGVPHWMAFKLIKGFGAISLVIGLGFFIISDFDYFWGIVIGVGIIFINLGYLFLRKFEKKLEY